MTRPGVGRELSWPRCGSDHHKKKLSPTSTTGGRETRGAVKVPLETCIPRSVAGDVAKGGEREKRKIKATQVAFGRRIEAAPKRPMRGNWLLSEATAQNRRKTYRNTSGNGRIGPQGTEGRRETDPEESE